MKHETTIQRQHRPARRYVTQHAAVIKRGNAVTPYRTVETIVSWSADVAVRMGRDRCVALSEIYGEPYIYWTTEQRKAIRLIPQRRRIPTRAVRTRHVRGLKAAGRRAR